MSYHNFDVELNEVSNPDGSKTFEIRALRTDYTQPAVARFSRAAAEDSWNRIKTAWQLGLGRSAGPRRGESDALQTAVSNFGKELYANAFRSPIHETFERFKEEVNRLDEPNAPRLRVRLIINAQVLQQYPWEMLAPQDGLPIASRIDSSVVRYVGSEAPVRSLRVARPLNVLVLIADVGARFPEFSNLDVERERAVFAEAFRDLNEQDITYTVIDDVSLSAVRDRLGCDDTKRFHVVHYIGHGSNVGGRPVMTLFSADKQRVSHVTGDQFAPYMTDVQLVVLNCCHGAETVETAQGAGLAQQLVRHNVPAVIAMQAAITDEAAITFARTFYSSLALGATIDACLTNARLAIREQPNHLEWATPVLFMRSSENKLLDFERGAHDVKSLQSAQHDSTVKELRPRRKFPKLHARNAGLFICVCFVGAFLITFPRLHGPPPPPPPSCSNALPKVVQSGSATYIELGMRTRLDGTLRPANSYPRFAHPSEETSETATLPMEITCAPHVGESRYLVRDATEYHIDPAVGFPASEGVAKKLPCGSLVTAGHSRAFPVSPGDLLDVYLEVTAFTPPSRVQPFAPIPGSGGVAHRYDDDSDSVNCGSVPH